jgi:hypothetical protein
VKLTLCYRSMYRDQNLAIHASGCSDLAKERDEHGAHFDEGDYRSVSNALEHMLDPEMVEMGYDRSHVKVYPCCKAGPKVAKPLAEGICPGTGGSFAENSFEHGGRRLYCPCAVCGKSVGTARGKVPRHKPREKKVRL